MLLTGSPGGRTIINTVFTIVLGVTEYGLTGREAVDLPRMHHQWMPDRVTIEAGRRDRRDRSRALKRHGPRRAAPRTRQGDAHSIWVAPDGTPYGVNDKRTPDSKASVPRRLTAPRGGTIGCTAHVSRAAPSPAPSCSCSGGPVELCTRITRHHSSTQLTEASPDNRRGFFVFWTCRRHYGFLKTRWPDPGGHPGRRVERGADGRLHEPGGARPDASTPASRRSSAARADKLWTKGETSGNRLQRRADPRRLRRRHGAGARSRGSATATSATRASARCFNKTLPAR